MKKETSCRRRIREKKHWRKVAKRHYGEPYADIAISMMDKNRNGRKMRAEEQKLSDMIVRLHPGAEYNYLGIVKKVYRTFAKEHGFLSPEEMTGDDWAVSFRQRLDQMLPKEDDFSKERHTQETYYLISHAIYAVEQCYGITIDREKAGMEEEHYCRKCGAKLIPMEHGQMGCPICHKSVGTYSGTNIPAGILAGSKVRAMRSILHKNFDPLWKDFALTDEENMVRRNMAYRVLASYAGLPEGLVHFSRIRNMYDAERLLCAVNEMRKKHGLMILDEIVNGTHYHSDDWSYYGNRRRTVEQEQESQKERTIEDWLNRLCV